MQVRDAILLGVALGLVIFLVANFCSCFNASRVEELNSTIADVANDYEKEVQCFVEESQRRVVDENDREASKIDKLVVSVASLTVLRKF